MKGLIRFILLASVTIAIENISDKLEYLRKRYEDWRYKGKILYFYPEDVPCNSKTSNIIYHKFRKH
jgi:hypothetical protein